MAAMEYSLYYTVNFEAADDEANIDVSVLGLPGCFSSGRTYEEAILKAHEAIEGYIETLLKLGKPIPLGSNHHTPHGYLLLGVSPKLKP